MTPDDPDWGDDNLVDLYIGTFSARQDLYVQNGAAVVREPLDAEVVRRAMVHHYAISGYMADAFGRTQVGALDFDRTDGLVLARTTAQFLKTHGIPSLLAESRRGAHVWVTSWDYVEAGTMHRMLRAALALATDLPDETGVDLFPKHAGDKELSHGALRLPGMPHQTTQQVYPIWNGGTEPLSGSLRAIIEAHDLTDPAAIDRLAGQGPPRSDYPKGLDNFYGYSKPRDWGPEPSASQVLIEWGITNAKPGGTVRCPKHDDKRRSLTIYKDDKRVYCGSPACVLNGSGHGVGSVMLGKMER